MYKFDDIIGLWYYPEDNLFIDDNGFPVFDIFRMITPNDLFLFRHDKEYTLLSCSTNPKIGVELFYPDDDYSLYY